MVRIEQNIVRMLESCRAWKSALLPPTALYNEGWMLRLVLDWFAHHPDTPPLAFAPGARWFSEALLPSRFLPRTRGDALAEAWTHADGIIGQFEIGKDGRAEFQLHSDASQFVLLEAKMLSPLSSGVKHAAGFDQAARSLACMAEVLARADREPADLSDAMFYVIAPEHQVSAGIFTAAIAKESIQGKVAARVAKYQSTQASEWFDRWFLPTLKRIQVGCVTWEALLKAIAASDHQDGEELSRFYASCLAFNRLPES
jgi:hypothetical protein